MASYHISVQQRYQDIFGLVLRNVGTRVAKVGIGMDGSLYPPTDLLQSSRAPVELPNPYDDLETLETANGDPLAFLAFSRPAIGGTQTYALEIPAIIRSRRQKIEKETILNSDYVLGIEPGQVVEVSTWTPWDISVQGMLINPDHLEYPKIQVEAFQQFFSHHQLYDVESPLTNAIDVTTVRVSGSLDFQTYANYPDTVSYTLNLRSHVSPTGLILN